MANREIGSTELLNSMLASRPPREKVISTEHMRERIAVAIRRSRPSFFIHKPKDAYTLFLYETPEMRKMLEQWADDFLRQCDVLDLEMIDRRIENG
jgi:hypothetical protein